MPIQLDDVEARVLGSLVEKALTTPEQYPLSFNALQNACNQKSSREPVMELDPDALGKGVQSLVDKGLVERVHGSRALRFRHHIEKLLEGATPKEIGALTVLLLRGPQTAGEIKTRSERLYAFESTAEVEALLQDLSARPGGPFVARLARQPGQKEARYRHLFSPEAASSEPQAAAPQPPPADRLALLEKRVETLEARLQALETASTSWKTPIG